jgi:large subunit ribosomal protein L18
MRSDKRELDRQRRHQRVRLRVFGTSARPRLNIYRSLGNIYAQVIDDTTGGPLTSASSLDEEVSGSLKTGGNVKAAAAVGRLIAERALKVKVTAVVFDRGGYRYHGRIKALADAARERGLKF